MGAKLEMLHGLVGPAASSPSWATDLQVQANKTYRCPVLGPETLLLPLPNCKIGFFIKYADTLVDPAHTILVLPHNARMLRPRTQEAVLQLQSAVLGVVLLPPVCGLLRPIPRGFVRPGLYDVLL